MNVKAGDVTPVRSGMADILRVPGANQALIKMLDRLIPELEGRPVQVHSQPRTITMHGRRLAVPVRPWKARQHPAFSLMARWDSLRVDGALCDVLDGATQHGVALAINGKAYTQRKPMLEFPRTDVSDNDFLDQSRYRAFLRHAARRMWAPRADVGTVSDDDLMQEGRLALCDARKRFDPTRKGSWEGFARTCVHNAMVDLLKGRCYSQQTETRPKRVPIRQCRPYNSTDARNPRNEPRSHAVLVEEIGYSRLERTDLREGFARFLVTKTSSQDPSQRQRDILLAFLHLPDGDEYEVDDLEVEISRVVEVALELDLDESTVRDAIPRITAAWKRYHTPIIRDQALPSKKGCRCESSLLEPIRWYNGKKNKKSKSRVADMKRNQKKWAQEARERRSQGFRQNSTIKRENPSTSTPDSDPLESYDRAEV